MLKKTIKYTDLDGNEREEVFYFNMSKTELLREESSLDGGFAGTVQKIMDGRKGVEMVQMFTNIICTAYGEKSADGRRFIKTPELRLAFEQSPAFDALITEMLTDPNAAADFVNGVMPKDLEEIAKKMELQSDFSEKLSTAQIVAGMADNNDNV